MSYYKEYKKIQEQRRKAAGKEPEKKETYYRQYKAIQEARARDLASKTAENLKSMNGTTKLMSMQESFGNTMTGTYADPVKRHVVNSTLRAMNYANKKDEDKIMSDIETSFAKREDRDNILSQVNNPVNTNKRNRNTIMSNNRASEEFVNQFANKSAYDNAINMVRYGDKNYDELMAISKANADKKAAGININEDEDKWIKEYADRVKTSADVEKERAQLREDINTQDEKIQENIQARWQQKEDVNPFDKHKKNAADMFNNPTPEVAAKNHMKEKESLKKALEKLDKEYENRKQREYYESLPGMDDFEEVAAIGRARKDNYANETDKDLDWRDYNYWTQLYRMEQRVYEPAKGDYMSDEEKNIYSYILEKEGNKKQMSILII